VNWLAKLIAGRSDGGIQDPAVAEVLEQWRALEVADPTRPHFETRYTVLNTEATGLNLEQDSLLAVAAIAIDEGQIAPSQSYYAPLTPEPVVTLANLLSFCGKGPVIAFNAAFNRSMLERAFETHLGFVPELLWLDLYVLLPALFPERIDHPARLADWMNSFGIETFQRHHALGDAWAIAQLALAANSRALSSAYGSARVLADMERMRRQLRRQS